MQGGLANALVVTELRNSGFVELQAPDVTTRHSSGISQLW
jgi:hypothetical protein